MNDFLCSKNNLKLLKTTSTHVRDRDSSGIFKFEWERDRA